MSFSAQDFRAATGVSQETLTKFESYATLLTEWQKKINLVGPKTIEDLWQRHFMDSAQLYPLLPPNTQKLADFGSGAGLPALPLAILGVPDVHAVESDQRKGIFMREAARAAQTPLTVHTSRIEELAPLGADVVTARALAPLPLLLALTVPHLRAGGTALFLKGSGWQEEVKLAGDNWEFHIEHIPSTTAKDGAILRLTAIKPREAL